MHTDLVRAGCDKAVVEALFVLDGEDLILRRELTAALYKTADFMRNQPG